MTDATGNLFIAALNNHRIRRVDAATGIITTVARNGRDTFCGDGGPATDACLWGPNGVALDASGDAVAVDATGNLFIADTGNQRIRRVDAATGIITTVAGGTWGFCGDAGLATEAWLAAPQGVAVDSTDSLLIGDYINTRVRLVQ